MKNTRKEMYISPSTNIMKGWNYYAKDNYYARYH